jgi:hypothetical protein
MTHGGELMTRACDKIRTLAAMAPSIFGIGNMSLAGSNLITYIRQTDQRRQVSWKLQAEVVELADDDIIFTVELIIAGKTRWNSVYLMIMRGE